MPVEELLPFDGECPRCGAALNVGDRAMVCPACIWEVVRGTA